MDEYSEKETLKVQRCPNAFEINCPEISTDPINFWVSSRLLGIFIGYDITSFHIERAESPSSPGRITGSLYFISTLDNQLGEIILKTIDPFDILFSPFDPPIPEKEIWEFIIKIHTMKGVARRVLSSRGDTIATGMIQAIIRKMYTHEFTLRDSFNALQRS